MKRVIVAIAFTVLLGVGVLLAFGPQSVRDNIRSIYKNNNPVAESDIGITNSEIDKEIDAAESAEQKAALLEVKASDFIDADPEKAAEFLNESIASNPKPSAYLMLYTAHVNNNDNDAAENTVRAAVTFLTQTYEAEDKDSWIGTFEQLINGATVDAEEEVF